MQAIPFHCQFTEPNESMGFSRFDLDYWKSPQQFSELLSGLPNSESVLKQIERRSTFVLRTEIASILRKQYQHFDQNSRVFEQIKKLELKNSYTVICAHQPCLMGGPMYWVYKILSTIKLCQEFKSQYPDYHFIPVYFSGNEDHDFEEINAFQIFQKRITWNENAGPATGRMPVNGLQDVLSNLEMIFERNQNALNFIQSNTSWLQQSNTYGEYFRHFVNHLFGDLGLIYFNPDDAEAKSLFAPIIKNEISSQFIYHNTLPANDQIQKMHYPLQVNPRELNLFYHHTTGRKRLTKNDGLFQLVDTNVRWTESELLNDLKDNPVNFSPNVLLRPLYQEFLFPNVAFVGGGGEIAYWMQLKQCFQSVSIPYPLLFRRLSAFLYDQSLLSKITKTPFPPEAFLNPLQDLEKEFIKSQIPENIPDEDVNSIHMLLEKIRVNCEKLDASSRSSIESEIQKISKSLEHISSKRNKVIKQKYEQDLMNIRKIKDVLFPSNSIQERIQNFLPYYFIFGNSFFETIMDNYNPSLSRVCLFMENKI
jgi:bacillithiol biosynthesis cysteine-adding enzyme BshC